MPRKNGALTPREGKAIAAYVASGDKAYSAATAGYASQSGLTNALARPAVQAEVVRLQQERVTNELLPLAVETHIRMLRDDRTPAGAKAALIKIAYDRGFGTEGGTEKEPHEMTAGEIADNLARLQREAAERARPIMEVSAEPAGEPDMGGVFD